MLVRHKGMSSTSLRQSVSALSVSHDERGLLTLVSAGNHRAAVNLCGKMLTALGQGFGCATQESAHSPESLKWWHARFSLLLHLKLFELAVTEFEQFGSFDTADLYYGFYPDLYPGRRGSMVPFSLRLLHAGFPRHVNKPHQALGQLYALHSVCSQIITNLESGKAEDGTAVELKAEDKRASLVLWNNRKIKVMFCICNTLLQLREYSSAIDLLDDVMKLSPGSSVSIQSSIGRILLQLGDLKTAQQRFAAAEKAAGNDEKHKFQLTTNRAFLYLGANNWKEALRQFTEALEINPNHIETLNNKAVCLLYLCRLRDAIAVQEEATRVKQKNENEVYSQTVENEAVQEAALSNLVTLYELESSKSQSKKHTLLQHVAATCGDGFNVACLKM